LDVQVVQTVHEHRSGITVEYRQYSLPVVQLSENGVGTREKMADLGHGKKCNS